MVEEKQVVAKVSMQFESPTSEAEGPEVNVDVSWIAGKNTCFDYLSISGGLKGDYKLAIFLFKKDELGIGPTYEKIEESTLISAPRRPNGAPCKLKALHLSFE